MLKLLHMQILYRLMYAVYVLKGWAYIMELTFEAPAHDVLVGPGDSSPVTTKQCRSLFKNRIPANPVAGSHFMLGCRSILWFPASCS